MRRDHRKFCNRALEIALHVARAQDARNKDAEDSHLRDALRAAHKMARELGYSDPAGDDDQDDDEEDD